MTTFRASRDIPASPDQVFAAFTDPQRLARWWGPAGFTITLASSARGTTVSWEQAFESDQIASRIEHIVVPANDQNLERLSFEVLGKLGGGDGARG